jgi:hypothetical protein
MRVSLSNQLDLDLLAFIAYWIILLFNLWVNQKIRINVWFYVVFIILTVLFSLKSKQELRLIGSVSFAPFIAA